jgi:hypothetical protein
MVLCSNTSLPNPNKSELLKSLDKYLIARFHVCEAYTFELYLGSAQKNTHIC